MKKEKLITINLEKLIQISILILFCINIIYLIVMNLINKYLHPKFNIYIILFLIFISVSILIEFKDILLERKNSIFKIKYLLFGFLLFILYITPAKSIDTDIANLRGVNVGNNNTIYKDNQNNRNNSYKSESKYSTSYQDNNIIETDNSQDSSITKKSDIKITQNKKEDPIIIDSRTFVIILDAIFTNPGRFEGKTIKIKGFIFRAKEFPIDRFAIARMGIFCCAADAIVVGIICKYSEYSSLKEKEWYELEGILHTEKNQEGKLEPYTEVTGYKKIEKDADNYIYLSNY